MNFSALTFRNIYTDCCVSFSQSFDSAPYQVAVWQGLEAFAAVPTPGRDSRAREGADVRRVQREVLRPNHEIEYQAKASNAITRYYGWRLVVISIFKPVARTRDARVDHRGLPLAESTVSRQKI